MNVSVLLSVDVMWSTRKKVEWGFNTPMREGIRRTNFLLDSVVMKQKKMHPALTEVT